MPTLGKMKSLNEIFQWSTTKRTVAFEQNGWFVYYSHNYLGDKKSTYIAHGCLENKDGWRADRRCQGCNTPVPESIQTVYVLLQWSEQGYADPI